MTQPTAKYPCDTCGHSWGRHASSGTNSCFALYCTCSKYEHTISDDPFAPVRTNYTPYSDHLSQLKGTIMANDQTRTLPSGATVTESDIKTLEKEATKNTLRNVFALVGVGATLVFVRNRLNIKAVPLDSNNS